ncbi:MAG: DNA polymerase III subunit delta [bacterium]|nr:DNA polymerase III subunit delta [bacterium]
MAKRRSSNRKSGPTPGQLLDKIRQGNIAPLYYLHGPEEFEKEEVLQALIETTVEPAARVFNLDIFRAEDLDLAEAINQTMAFPMMAARRMVVLKRVEHLPDASARDLIPLIQSPPETTVLVLTADKPDSRKKLFTELKKNAFAVEFKTPFDNEIPGWIQNRSKVLGQPINADAAHLLHRSVGSNLRELNSELEKLIISAAPNSPLTREDVARVVASTRGVTIFELADAMGHRQTGKATALLKRLLEQGESPVGIVAMLLRHITILRKAQWVQGLPRSEMASRLKVRPFFLNNYLDQARGFEDQDLWNAFDALLEADNTLKSRSSAPYIVLSNLIYRICRSASLSPP